MLFDAMMRNAPRRRGSRICPEAVLSAVAAQGWHEDYIILANLSHVAITSFLLRHTILASECIVCVLIYCECDCAMS